VVADGSAAGLVDDRLARECSGVREMEVGLALQGLDLSDDGVTANTAGGPHSGPNDFQNFPVLGSARVVVGTLLVTGSLNSQLNTTYRVEFFASPTSDPSGHGDGQVYLGYTTVTTDFSGNASFAALAPFAGPVGWVVSATATVVFGSNTVSVLAAGDTSEFSNDVTVS
jgi:titin